MNNTIFLISAYMLIWVVLFGYIWNIQKKQKRLAKEIEILNSEAKRK